MNSSTNLENKTQPKNYITGKIKVKEGEKKVRIINSYENWKREKKSKNNDKFDNENFHNENEIKSNIQIIIDEKPIDFSYYYEFIP